MPHNSKVKNQLKFTELDINASQACLIKRHQIHLKSLSFSACSGMILTSYSKYDPGKKLKKEFYSSIGQYKKFKKMYEIDTRLYIGKMYLKV